MSPSQKNLIKFDIYYDIIRVEWLITCRKIYITTNGKRSDQARW